ncbi:hypothetical protein DTO027B5_7196 [Paecilomyces variotii]|nr:hypothetical protein DTO032I3_4367 [Paecilomyces variotii]KAJ9220148.1 hypothetical protein DTO169C6_7567 [Paecilomyces variotii]KAJ9230476.1 hypothetical protein DTO169E5_8439 [Paecilomyces variotii]KAJ9249048.1 hypothetical protein DTO207G8_6975 [Paecilomyces variotii]KAJ9278451.1 hypothetical protein DTO021D3_4649 [Paecilomyces variotii]
MVTRSHRQQGSLEYPIFPGTQLHNLCDVHCPSYFFIEETELDAAERVNALPVWDQLARGRRLKSPLHHRCDTYQTPEAPPWVLSVKAGAGVYMPQLRSHIAN